MRAATLVILLCSTSLSACSLSSADESGDVGQADAQVIDANSTLPTDAGHDSDAALGLCQADRLRFVVGDRPLMSGDYCDDIQLCAANAAVAEEVTEILPGFVCEPSGCADGEFSCQWFRPDDIDAAEYGDLCSLTMIENAPQQVLCYLYL